MSTDELKAAQHEVQRLLGRCLLRMQQYEILLKRILAFTDISGPAPELVARLEKRVAKRATTNLGLLAKELFESFVVIGRNSEMDSRVDALDTPTNDSMRIRTVMRLEAEPEDFAATKKAVEDLVQMRNSLVHHFIEDFDMSSADGCAAGAQRLVDFHDRIDVHFEQLRGWATAIQEAVRAHNSFMESQEYEDFIDGIGPDGQVMWPDTAIAGYLHMATSLRARDGWTRLEEAAAFITKKYPKQTPQRYGCTSWPEVVARSKAFQLQHRGDSGAPKVCWYRERPKPSPRAKPAAPKAFPSKASSQLGQRTAKRSVRQKPPNAQR